MRALVRLQVACGHQEPLVAIDAKLQLEACLPGACGRLSCQKRRVFLVHPEIGPPVRLILRHMRQPRCPRGVKDEFDRLAIPSNPRLTYLVNRNTQLLLPFLSGLNGHTRYRPFGRVRRTTLDNNVVRIVSFFLGSK